MKRNYENNLKAKLVDELDLPKDLYLGCPLQTLSGNREMLIENYRGILIYTREVVLVQAKTIRIRIEGKNLVIQYYTNDEMKISGIIKRIIYE